LVGQYLDVEKTTTAQWARQHLLGWTVLNFNLMADGNLASTS
jgi:hypothetical protein